MKLCFIAGTHSIHAIKWINFFAENGHEIHWISVTPKIEGKYDKKINFYHLNTSSKFALPKQCLWDIKRLIKKINPDILHVHYAGINGLLGVMTGFHPLIITAWGDDILNSRKSFIKKPIIKYFLKKADLITCDAEHMKRAMIGLNALSQKIKIIYFGIDTQKFNPKNKDHNLKQNLKISSPVIISLRSFEPVYDLKTLIYSIPRVLKKFPKAIFLIVGNGTMEIELKKLTKKLDINKNVRFIGFIPNDKLPVYLNFSDIYVSTSLSDGGIAASTAEAMACSVPVIITDSGENNIWINNKKNGLLVPVKNPEYLAEKIIFLLQNKQKRKNIGLNGRKTIVERNNYYKEMEKMEKLYKNLVSKNK